jgi:phage virion morphogenesis protein
MPGGLTFSVDDRQARELFKKLLEAGHGADVTRPLAEAMLSDTLDTFEAQGRPEKWKPLSPATLLRTGPHAILQQTGSHLRDRITPGWSDSEASIGVQWVAAAIHQFGGKAGRGKKVNIPARPYLVETETMIGELVATMEEVLGRAAQ